MRHSIPLIIARKELQSVFTSPLAYIFLVIFLVLSGALTFFLGGFLGRGQADLVPFFDFHPWLFLLFVPALTMRLWAEEKRSGTMELLMTLPLATPQAVMGKFLAIWLFTGLALLLTTPMWLTVNYLGDPDNGVIIAGYLGSWLLAGVFVAVGCFCSALTRNQVVAFILSATVCFALIVGGTPLVLNFFSGWAPLVVLEAVASLSVLTHFETISKGLLHIRDLLFFGLMICFFLGSCYLYIEACKGEN